MVQTFSLRSSLKGCITMNDCAIANQIVFGISEPIRHGARAGRLNNLVAESAQASGTGLVHGVLRRWWRADLIEHSGHAAVAGEG